MKKSALTNQAGFTLVELLTIVATIGILAAIGLVQFSSYRQRGFEATLRADLKNAAIAQESYFAQTRTYKSGSLSSATLTGYNRSSAITGINAVTAGGTFVLQATHANCGGTFWSYNSSTATITGGSCS